MLAGQGGHLITCLPRVSVELFSELIYITIEWNTYSGMLAGQGGYLITCLPHVYQLNCLVSLSILSWL